MTVMSYAPSTPEDRIRRRRALFNDYTRRRKAREAAQAAPEPTEAVSPVSAPPKGVCGTCGKYIGRGVAFHRKRCEG